LLTLQPLKIVGNAVVNSGVSGLIAVATGGNVEQSMITGAIVGGAIASAPDIANTLMGGESNSSMLLPTQPI